MALVHNWRVFTRWARVIISSRNGSNIERGKNKRKKKKKKKGQTQTHLCVCLYWSGGRVSLCRTPTRALELHQHHDRHRRRRRRFVLDIGAEPTPVDSLTAAYYTAPGEKKKKKKKVVVLLFCCCYSLYNTYIKRDSGDNIQRSGV